MTADIQTQAVRRRLAYATHPVFIDALCREDRWPREVAIDVLLLCGCSPFAVTSRYMEWTKLTHVPPLNYMRATVTNQPPYYERFLQHLQQEAATP